MREKEWYKKIPAFVKWVCTMTVVFAAWLFFMSKDLPAAWKTVTGLFVPASPQTVTFTWNYYLENRIIILLAVCCILVVCSFEKPRAFWKRLSEKPAFRIIGRVLLLGLLVADLMFVFNAGYHPFMYFQF